MSTGVLAVGHVPTIALSAGRLRRGLVLAVAALVAVAGLELVRPLVSAERSPRPAPATATAPTQGTWPAGLRDAARAAVTADAYNFAPAAGGGWATITPAQGLHTSVGPTGLAVGPLGGGSALDLSLARLGRPGALVAVEPAEVMGSAQGVELRRGPGLTEWYRNDARGLEQGFTLATAPAGGPGPLVLELDASGLAVALSPDGTEVLASTDAAGPVLRYGGLEVTDASGRQLPARLGVEGQAVQLLIDDAGATYPLAVDPWFQQAKLTAPDPGFPDEFGGAVAVSGDIAIVGAFQAATPGGSSAGAAYMFVRSAGSWTMQQKLVASDTAAGDNFGTSVAISGTTAVVGAPGHDTTEGVNAGEAYVFVQSGVFWIEQQKITVFDGALGDSFGSSVAISGSTVVVGSPDSVIAGRQTGSAYVFVFSAGWILQQKLIASDGDIGDMVGETVAVSGDTAVLGASLHTTVAGANAGAAYVFVRAAGVWTQQQQLLASDALPGDLFGSSVAVSGDTAVVGAPQDDTAPNSNSGSAYVFLRTGSTWAQQQKLPAADPTDSGMFGASVAVDGDTAVVGSQTGAAYVFARSGVTWTQQKKLTASDGNAFDGFGEAVAVSGGTALVGAGFANTPTVSSAGAAYVYILTVDSVKPTCSYTIVAGPPKHIDFTVQDVGSGIATVAVTTAVNIVTPVTITFGSGTTAPVHFTATKAVQTTSAQVAIVITDVAGNQSSCI